MEPSNSHQEYQALIVQEKQEQGLGEHSELTRFLRDKGWSLQAGDYIILSDWRTYIVLNMWYEYTKEEVQDWRWLTRDEKHDLHKKGTNMDDHDSRIHFTKEVEHYYFWAECRKVHELGVVKEKEPIGSVGKFRLNSHTFLKGMCHPNKDKGQTLHYDLSGELDERGACFYRGDVFKLIEHVDTAIDFDGNLHGLLTRSPLEDEAKSQETGVARLSNDLAPALTKADNLRSWAQNQKALKRVSQNKMDYITQKQQKQMRKLMDQMTEVLIPVNRVVRRLTALIRQMQIYTGVTNNLLQIGSGTPGDRHDPVHIYQKAFYMDEEVGDPADRGINFEKVEDFDRWLTAIHPKFKVPNHKVIIPHEKAMVIFRVRRSMRHYSDDPWINSMIQANDKSVYLLIINGDNIFRVWAGAEQAQFDSELFDLKIGEKLFPDEGEIAALKERVYEAVMEKIKRKDQKNQREAMEEVGKEYEEKKPDSIMLRMDELSNVEKGEITEKFEITEHHYRLNLLLIQGLLDRYEIFPGLADNVRLLEGDILQNPYVKFMFNNEHGCVRLGEEEESFFDWLKRINSRTKIGSRIYWLQPGYFNEQMAWEMMPSTLRDQKVDDRRRELDGDDSPRTSAVSAAIEDRLFRKWNQDINDYTLREIGDPPQGIYVIENWTNAKYPKGTAERYYLDSNMPLKYWNDHQRATDQHTETKRRREKKSWASSAWFSHIHREPYRGPYVRFYPGGDYYSWTEGYTERKNAVVFAIDLGTDLYVNYDAMTREDLVNWENWMYDRQARRHYIKVIPLIEGVIEQKRKEMQIEDAFARELMKVFNRQLKADTGQFIKNEEGFIKLAVEAIDWWKLKNRYKRPLPFGDQWKKTYIASKHAREHDPAEYERLSVRMIHNQIRKKLGLSKLPTKNEANV